LNSSTPYTPTPLTPTSALLSQLNHNPPLPAPIAQAAEQRRLVFAQLALTNGNFGHLRERAGTAAPRAGDLMGPAAAVLRRAAALRRAPTRWRAGGRTWW